MTITKRLLPLAAIALSMMVAVFVASGAFTRSVDVASAHTGTGTAHLELDMDTTNGICGASVDAANTVLAGDTFDVAICLSDGNDAPISGDLVNFTTNVSYPAYVTAPDGVCSIPATCRDSNPDFQDPAAPEADWDCNQLDNPASEPSGSPSPATITCATGDVAPNPLTNGVSDVIAIVSFTADSPGGPDPMNLTGGPQSSAGEFLCGTDIVCDGGTITVLDSSDIEVEKSCPASAISGTSITCTVLVTNNGTANAGNVIVFDDMADAPGVVYNDVATDLANGGVNYCDGPVVFPPIVATMNVISCGTIGLGVATPISLNAGDDITLSLVFDISEDQAGKQLNNAAIGIAASFGLPIMSNPPDPNLDPLVGLIAASPLCNLNPDPITCAGLTILLSPAQLCGTPNIVGITGNPAHAAIGLACNNEDRASIDVEAADVSISKVANNAAPGVGNDMDYTVTVTNGAGGSPAAAVVITDTVNSNQSINSAVLSVPGACVIAPAYPAPGNTATCTLTNSIAPGDPAVTVDILAEVVLPLTGLDCVNNADVTFADPITLDANEVSVPCLSPTTSMFKSTEIVGNPDDAVAAANLWLCLDPNPAGPGPDNPNCEYYDAATGNVVNNGAGHLVVYEHFYGQFDADGAGAFEFQLKFDHKIFDIDIFHGIDKNGDGDCDDLGEDQAQTPNGCYLYQTGRVPNWTGGVGGCEMSIFNENFILFGCVSKNPETDPVVITPGPSGLIDVLATIHISPEPDLVHRLTPGQKNGVLRTVLDENCEVADIFGDPLGTGETVPGFPNREILLPGIVTGGLVESCEDITITTRILEGDLNLDCEVDVTDDQAIAFRYGSFFGNLLYDPWFDLEPSLKDFDVDIKDLQKVFGRNGSTCDAPIPDQDPQTGGGFSGAPDPGPLP